MLLSLLLNLNNSDSDTRDSTDDELKFSGLEDDEEPGSNSAQDSNTTPGHPNATTSQPNQILLRHTPQAISAADATRYHIPPKYMQWQRLSCFCSQQSEKTLLLMTATLSDFCQLFSRRADLTIHKTSCERDGSSY